MSNTHISSAELTALWRTTEPTLSGDALSHLLVSTEGKAKADVFIETMDYPLICRKMTTRAHYFLSSATALLQSHDFDACISVASGFSMLTYLIAQASQRDIPYYDTDLPTMMVERNKRVQALSPQLQTDVLNRIHTKGLDLEEACREGKRLTDVFPTVKKPVFLIEGIIYFLSETCVQWLFDEIAHFEHSAFILDYWPKEPMLKSEVFLRSMRYLQQEIPEKMKSYFTEATLAMIRQNFSIVDQISIQSAENALAEMHQQVPQLLDSNYFFPVELMVGVHEKSRCNI